MKNKDKITIIQTIGDPIAILHNSQININKWLNKHVENYKILDFEQYYKDVPVSLFIDDKGDAQFSFEFLASQLKSNKNINGANVLIEEEVILNDKGIGTVKYQPLPLEGAKKIWGWIKLHENDYEPIEFQDKQFKFKNGKPNEKIIIKYYYHDDKAIENKITAKDYIEGIKYLGFK